MSGLTVYSTSDCADCKQLKAWLQSKQIPFTSHVVDELDDMYTEMLKLTNGRDRVPTVVYDDKVLQEPTIDEMKELLGMDQQNKTDEVFDTVMIGAGPASLTAAIYTCREDIKTVLYEKGVIGGLAAVTDWIDNYPGFPKGLAGLELAENLQHQAERFGADIRLGEVLDIESDDTGVTLETTDGTVRAKTALIATGSDYKKLGIPGEVEYYARGVHYCATCDGAFYRDKKLVVVGAGNSAVQEAIFLTKFASHIDLLVRSTITASEVLQHELEKHKDKITVHIGVTTDEIIGEDNKVTKVIGTNKQTNEKITYETDGVFVFIGLLPNTGFLKGKIDLDQQGLVLTDAFLETSMKHVFCAGDVRSGATMQIASAAGEGATAALMIRKRLEEMERAESSQKTVVAA